MCGYQIFQAYDMSDIYQICIYCEEWNHFWELGWKQRRLDGLIHISRCYIWVTRWSNQNYVNRGGDVSSPQLWFSRCNELRTSLGWVMGTGSGVQRKSDHQSVSCWGAAAPSGGGLPEHSEEVPPACVPAKALCLCPAFLKMKCQYYSRTS